MRHTMVPIFTHIKSMHLLWFYAWKVYDKGCSLVWNCSSTRWIPNIGLVARFNWCISWWLSLFWFVRRVGSFDRRSCLSNNIDNRTGWVGHTGVASTITLTLSLWILDRHLPVNTNGGKAWPLMPNWGWLDASVATAPGSVFQLSWF